MTETLAGGYRVLVPQPPLLPARNKQSSKQEKLQYNRQDWEKEEEKEECFDAFQFSIVFLLVHNDQNNCLAGALCQEQGVPWIRSRSLPGWWQAGTGLHLLCPSHGYPGRESCWNQGAGRNIARRQQIQNAEMGNRLMMLGRVRTF